MPKVVKVLKTKAYFCRFQVKYRRRRECRTDYYARRRLILQDKNKYGTPKYRFVVRFTNKDIICQIFSAGLTHDSCLAAAYSHELQRYGIKLGLTNYSAAYCTGLLLARRLNTKLKLDYEGNTEDLGEYYEVEANEEGAAPFCALLDVGLKRATTGSRLFGALKGACDGGIDIPHGDKRFPRPKSDARGKDYEPDAEFHRKYIFGGHVAEYMTKLKDDDEEAYKKQFSAYIKAGIEPEDLEGMYEAAHKSIREDPFKARGDLELGLYKQREKPKDKDFKDYEHKKWPSHPIKLTCAQRKARIIKKLKKMGKVKKYRSAADQAIFDKKVEEAELAKKAKRKRKSRDRLKRKRARQTKYMVAQYKKRCEVIAAGGTWKPKKRRKKNKKKKKKKEETKKADEE